VIAAILAGGLGTRLRPVVADRPKALAEVRGRSFLAYLLDQLTEAGARRVVLCTGHLGKQVQAEFGQSYGPLRLAYSQEATPLGTAGALRLALPLLNSSAVLVMNGDSLCDVDLSAFWSWHRERGAKASLVLTKVPDTSRYGRVNVSQNGDVLRFDEKGRECGPGWINAGIYLIARPLIEATPANRAVSLEREMFPAWVGQGLYGYQTRGRFLDIGTPEAYAMAEQFFAERPR
jgi:NDP-sugar pyrophosphorylase family protein